MAKNHLLAKLILLMTLAMLAGQGGRADNGSDLDKYPVRLAVIGDRTGSAVAGIYGRIVQEIEQLHPDFVMTVGDMIEGPVTDSVILVKEWNEYDSIISILSRPIYFVPGNNDIENDLMEREYKRRIGETYYSFDHRGIHIIVLDNSRWSSSDKLPAEQIGWLIDDLEKNQDAVHKLAFFHKPFWEESLAEGRPDTLHSIFVNYGVDAVFSGHYHAYFTGQYDGVRYTNVGSSGAATYPGPTGLKYHFVWVTVDDNNISIAPIEMGAVLPWNVITAEERNFVQEIERKGLSFDHAFELIHGNTFSNFGYKVNVSNISTDMTIEDTLRWKVPPGWSINPVVMPVTVPPGETVSGEFVIATDGTIYPAPKVSINFPYAPEKRTSVTRKLPIVRYARCHTAGKRPDIDGRLNEDFWADPVTGLFAPDGGPMAIDSVYFYFAHDDENLYLAAHCRESDMDKIVESVNEHDGPVYGEDCIGYFFCPDYDSMYIYQIYFNPRGYVFDQKIWLNEDGHYMSDREWNGDYKVKTFKGDDFWSIEAVIPAALFGVNLNQGSKWGLNFRRKQKRLERAADWMTPIGYDPEYMGRLVMQ